jgi:phosphoserine phosphatase
LPDLLRNFRNWREAFFQGSQVKAGAADHDRQAPFSNRSSDLGEGETAPPRRGSSLGGVEKTVKPVRRPALAGLVRTRGQDAEIAIDLQGVGIDDYSAQRSGQFESEAGFSTRCRTRDDQYCRLVAMPIAGVGGRLMSAVLTLIAGCRNTRRLDRIAEMIADRIEATTEPVWLSPGEACDLVLEAGDLAGVERVARSLIDGAAVDVLVQPSAGRRKQLLVADMESTIIENEMLDELADFLGLRAQVSEITRRAMNGEIDFVTALNARVGLLKGSGSCVLEEAASRIRLTPGARELVATMRAQGAVTALVSGGFAIFAERVAALLGFDHVVANRLDLTAGRIAGTVRPPIVTGESKRQVLLRLATENGIPLDRALAVGDGANDLPMLTAAGMGVAFHAKPLVAASARWRIDHAGLRALLFAQGYRADEFIG